MGAGAGFLSSVSEELRPEEEGGPRLLRWEIRGFLDIKGSMKSVSGWRFSGDVGSLVGLLEDTDSVFKPNLRARFLSH